jgi:superfamily I DNA/RNA helicase
MEDIYYYNGRVYSLQEFKKLHPLLFTKTTDTISDTIKQSELVTKIVNLYPDILNDRLNDKNKAISDSETLSDKFMVIEKDISYGYAITSHKSQGSTYNNVFVDFDDFEKITNRYNFKLKKYENRTRERNQLKYVAITRPKNNLFILKS